jgi:hemerythrin-like domain-containing protein
VEEIVYLIKNFADGLHHSKEENILFPFLETRGFSAQSGPVAVMVHEHILGRNYVKGISEGLALYKQGNKAGVMDINRNMQGYIDLLRNHILKENNVLFRMADGVISDEDDKNLISKFDSVTEDKDFGKGGGDFIARIEKLAAAYGI